MIWIVKAVKASYCQIGFRFCTFCLPLKSSLSLVNLSLVNFGSKICLKGFVLKTGIFFQNTRVNVTLSLHKHCSGRAQVVFFPFSFTPQKTVLYIFKDCNYIFYTGMKRNGL